MIRRLAAALLIALALTAAASSLLLPEAPAQDLGSKVKVRKVAFDPPTAPRGGTASLRIEFEFAPPLHMYPQSDRAQCPKFDWTLPAGWEPLALEDVSVPHEIEAFGSKVMAFEKELVVRQSFRVPAAAPLGNTNVTALGRWQSCDDSMCYPEADVPLAASVEVVAGAAGAGDPGAAGGGAQAKPPDPAPVGTGATPEPAPDDAEGDDAAGAEEDAETSAAAKGTVSLTLLLEAIAAGLLTVLTPCVFPLLPVTVSFFSKQTGPALPRSLVYGAGIVFTITVIGLALHLLLGVFDRDLDSFARDWAFNLAIGVLFLVLALSLFGLFDLRVPSFLLDWTGAKSGSGGLVGVFFMAVTLALTSFSCSMPFLALLFDNFAAGGYVAAVVGLAAFGSTMAMPFFLCSLFPSALTALPKSGDWMNAIKVTMGFVEFALAFKFLRTVAQSLDWDVLPRSFVLAIWVACALGAAAYLFGYVVLPHDTKIESVGVVRLVFAIAFLSGALYLLPGVFRKPLADWVEGFLQTQQSELDGSPHIPWIKNDWEGALERARLANRPVLMDLTGVG